MDWWRSSAGVAGLLVLPLCCAVLLLLPLQSAQAWSLAATATPASDSAWSPVVAGRASTVASKAATTKTKSFGRQLNRKLFRHVIPFKLKASLCFEWMNDSAQPAHRFGLYNFFFFRTKDETKTKYMRRNIIKNTDTTLLLQWNFCSLSWMWERWVKFKFIGHYIIGGECRLDYCWKEQEGGDSWRGI